MKTISRIFDIILYIIIGITLISSIGAAIFRKPFILTAVRSNSMYPAFQRGDMLFISPVSPKTKLNIGDIIIFDPEEGSLSLQGVIAHRIYEGNDIDGYITKGDANRNIDQISKNDSKIKKEWISNRVIMVGNTPLKIPLLGYIPIWMESFQKSTYLLPSLAVVLAIIIGISEFTKNKKKKMKNKNKLDKQLIYFCGGLAVSIMLGASMLAMGQHLNLIYEVSDSSEGVIMGSDVGILKVGETIEKPLSELSNKGIFPIISTSTSKDAQISFSHDVLALSPGQSYNTTYTINAKTPGKYESTIHIGMFLPLLPKSIILALSEQSYWLALVVTSLIPGLPIMLYPLIDSKLRRKTIKVFRKRFRKIRSALSI